MPGAVTKKLLTGVILTAIVAGIAGCVTLCGGYRESVRVIHVEDGDTVTVSAAGAPVVVRLAGIDAPEIKGKYITATQPYGPEATERLRELIGGKLVSLKEHGREYYKRHLGTIYLDGEDINLKMVREGLAVSYPKRGKKHPYRIAEEEARAARLGLWSRDNPVRPMDWRKSHRTEEK